MLTNGEPVNERERYPRFSNFHTDMRSEENLNRWTGVPCSGDSVQSSAHRAPHPAAEPNPVVSCRPYADLLHLQKLEHKVMQERYHFQLNNDHYM